MSRTARPIHSDIPPLALPATEQPKTTLGRWLLKASTPSEGPASHHVHHTHPWYMVLWLTGVDYFSSLGYQPGIALMAAGVLSPLATLLLVLVTLGGALPIYYQVSKRSYTGQGSISMLEQLLPGWWGKLGVLTLLGFAGTDFVITMTLSAADAAQHAVQNPFLHPLIGNANMAVTLVLLALLAAVFLAGFSEAINVAVVVAVPYIVLNAIVAVRCLQEVATRPELLAHWKQALFQTHGDLAHMLLASALVFPALALGMSGFETGVSVMPLITGTPPDEEGEVPLGRVRATHKLLIAAALLMSILLIVVNFSATLLVPEAAYRQGGEASGRALAYLCHQLMGPTMGSIYDISTILILWFAGASAMAGMLNLIPRYLPRFGMAPYWVAANRPLVLVLFCIDVLVTVIFHADVDAQGGAYATGVLVLMLSASLAVSLAVRHEEQEADRLPAVSAYFWLVTLIFGYTLVRNVMERPDGVIIASIFIVSILVLSMVSRYYRSTELRVEHIRFVDQQSAELWPKVCNKAVNLVPLKSLTGSNRRHKAREIREFYKVHGPLAFLHVELAEDRSQFLSPIRIKIRPHQEDFVIEVRDAVAVANAIAYMSELVDPISIFLFLTRENSVAQAMKFLLWGEGETGILVYQILVRYWEETPAGDVRPLIFLMSD